MDPIRSNLGRLLLEEITPVVMVLTTPLAEEACRKNGLSFVDMITPFTLFKKIDVPVRTANDQPYRLQMFKIRLIYASGIRKLNYEAAEERLRRVASEANDKADLLSEPPSLETVFSKSESDLCPSWIKTFNRELIRTQSFSEHETFDHPVACLLVISSKDDQPIDKVVDLFDTDQLPSILNEGIMDPKMLKYYLILHDNQDGPADKATSILADMRSTFGPNDCTLLCINSSTEADGDNKDNSWLLPYKAYGLHDHDSTCWLSKDDVDEIKDLMQGFASNHIIPYMEQKIRALNQQVSATRKGFRNQIRNLWWRKGKDDMPEAPNGPTYTFSSIESQIRVLADYAFMLRDYELALSNYRLLSTDYKLDKSWKHYAGVQEMSGLSFFMLDQSRKESEYCMENAFTTYLKIGSSGQRNATRCGLWWAEMLKARGQYREAPGVYFRISNEEPSLHAAVMLEQASFCYVLSRPPMFRKYGFNLVLAGNRYYISDQKQHAIRTYRNALLVYKENPWNYINDNVHFNIARWYGILGKFDVAIKHMLEVLACGHQSLATQNTYLSDFFYFVQNMGKKFDVYKLQLPVFDMSSVKVIYEDHRTYASSLDANVNESIWQELEEEMVPSSSAVRSNWLDLQPNTSPLRKNNEFCVCVAGEAVKVSLELKNPLQISIAISGISLICELSTSFEATADTDAYSRDSGEYLEKQPSFTQYEDGENDSFAISKHDIVLGGGETKRATLEVTPRTEGILRLVGIRWTLSDSVIGYQFFESDTKKKNKKGKRSVRHSISNNLILVVIKGLAKLEGYIDCMPAKSFAGDLRPLMLKLRNRSGYSVKNIKLKISHARYLIPCSSADLNLNFPDCLEKSLQSESNDIVASTTENSQSLLYAFPQDITIQGGATFSWPLWFHAAIPGDKSLYISIYYEMESSSDITYRILRMHYSLEVSPSLEVSIVLSPCSSRLQEYLVRMDILNRTMSQSFTLHQISCFGNKWLVSPLPSCTSICSVETILANQASSCFFKLKDLRSNSSEHTSTRSDVLLGSEGSNDKLIDVSRSPLTNFHYQERSHRGKFTKGPCSFVDFILISKLGKSNSTSEQEPEADLRLFSHHTCYCSAASKSPIWWFMDGLRKITHDFLVSYCEADVHVVIHNCSEHPVSVRLVTFDDISEKNQSSDFESASRQGGWYDVSLTNDINAISNVRGPHSPKPTSESAPPFVWCSSSSSRVDLEPDGTAKVPLKVCIFTPGTYNLSNYELHWKLHPSQRDGNKDDRWSSGGGRGHPFYLTVLKATQ